MTETPQTPSRPPAPPRRPERKHPLRRFIAGLHTLLHACWSLLLLLTAAAIWLWVFGLPQPVTKRVLDRIRGDGFEVDVRHVHLGPSGVLQLEGFVMHGPPPLGASFLQAEQVGVLLDWGALLRGRDAWRGLHVRSGALRWPYAAPSAATSHVWQTTGLDFDLTQDPQQLAIAVHRCQSAGLDVTATGTVVRGAIERPRGFSWTWLSALASNSLAAPDWLETVRAEAAALRHSEPPALSLAFAVDPSKPGAARLDWEAGGGRTYVRQGVFEHWRCEGSYTEGVLEVRRLELDTGRGAALAHARWGTADGTIDVGLASDLPVAHILNLLPPGVREGLKREQVEDLDALHFEADVAPGPARTWMDRIDGRIASPGFVWHTIPLGDVSARFSVRRDGIRIDPLRAVVGRGAGAGPVALRWNSDRAGRYDGEVELGFDPHHALPVLTPGETSLVACFTFSNAPPHAAVRFTGTSGTNGQLAFDGQLDATGFTYRGVAVAQLSTGLRYTNGAVEMDRWMLVRPEGMTKGRLLVDLDANAEEMDMVSTIDPEALKQLIGPGFQHALDFTHFAGPAVIGARGRYVNDGPGTRLQVDIEAEKAALQWFVADRLTMQVGVEDDVYRFTNIAAEAYGGSVTGQFKLAFDTNGPPRYAVEAACAGVRLDQLIKAIRPDDPGEQQGRLAASVQMRGLVGAGQGTSVVGTGRVAVTEGQLSRIRLLGGLSSLLSKIAPGWGMASQTEFHSDFLIRNGRCETKDAMLEGSVLSIRVKGAYYFDQRVTFVVEVKPMRSGAVASLVRWVTTPVTRLLAFKLTGTLSDPQWRPINLPKEMFLIFD